MATRGWQAATLKDIAPRMARISPARAAQLRTRVAPRPSKYRNERVVVGGETFASKHEHAVWLLLQDHARRGAITDLRRQVPFTLSCPRGPLCTYVADFCWRTSTGELVVGDAKGFRTAMFRLKARWMRREHGLAIVLL